MARRSKITILLASLKFIENWSNKILFHFQKSKSEPKENAPFTGTSLDVNSGSVICWNVEMKWSNQEKVLCNILQPFLTSFVYFVIHLFQHDKKTRKMGLTPFFLRSVPFKEELYFCNPNWNWHIYHLNTSDQCVRCKQEWITFPIGL